MFFVNFGLKIFVFVSIQIQPTQHTPLNTPHQNDVPHLLAKSEQPTSFRYDVTADDDVTKSTQRTDGIGENRPISAQRSTET